MLLRGSCLPSRAHLVEPDLHLVLHALVPVRAQLRTHTCEDRGHQMAKHRDPTQPGMHPFSSSEKQGVAHHTCLSPRKLRA